MADDYVTLFEYWLRANRGNYFNPSGAITRAEYMDWYEVSEIGE